MCPAALYCTVEEPDPWQPHQRRHIPPTLKFLFVETGTGRLTRRGDRNLLEEPLAPCPAKFMTDESITERLRMKEQAKGRKLDG
ncbi:hypothetical protein EYF80_051381 [Liparis tanakae]|uniref:Uncharacterized protein n=1 Tax=Liparis tanakae TaxID=230148 RepID=A0A4Z2FB36_9TELE|nr:hypothetical protein EYF80_051381 [Liparis tanakae]